MDLMQYALEADPGRLTASFPTFDTRNGAERAAGFLNDRRPDLPAVRIIARPAGSAPGTPWRLA